MSETLQISQSWTWLPTKLPGCTAWFDAQDSNTVVLSGPSNVSDWLDKSGLSNNASGGTSPTYVSGSGVVFNGTTQYLSTAYTANPSAESFFAVASWTGATSFTSYQIIGANANNGREYAVRNDGTSNVVRWQIGGSTAGYGATAGVTSARFLTSGTYRPVAGGSTSLNGSNQSTRGAVTFSGSATTNIGVGYFTGLSNYFQGTINEIILYNREVSTEERQQVEGYLAYKWNLQSNLPSSHPYKISPPFQNTIILPTVPSGPIRLAKATPSSQFSGAINKVTANVFTPLSLSNYGPACLYWYDAQDLKTITFEGATTSVIGWNDKSGNGYNLLSNPAVNNPINYQSDSSNFKFLTGSGILSYIGPVNCEVMSFFIMYSDQEPTAGQQKFVFGAIPSGSIANSEDSLDGFIFESSNSGPPTGPYDISFFSGDRVSYTTNNFGGQVPLTMFEFDVNQVPGERLTDPSTIIQASWVNGYSSNGITFSAGGGGTRLSTAEGLSLGGLYSGIGTPSFTQIGSVYELIGVSGPITEEARQKMTSYFAWKYGQKQNIPQDNPYLLAPPRGTSY